MNWDAVGAIGEIFGALAVVITLVYLSRQLREHTKSLKVQSMNTTFSEFNELLKDIQSLDGIGATYRKALADEELSADEEHEIGYLYRRILNLNDKMRFLIKLDAADDYNQAAFERAMPHTVKPKAFRKWWPQYRNRYSEDFQLYVQEFLDATDRD